MDPLTSLIAACVAFVGSHFAMSHPLRAPMVRMLGEKGFLGVYSLVSLAAFVWIVLAFRAAPAGTPLWPGFGDLAWGIASVLTLVAMVLLAGSFAGNPALPETPPEKAAQAEARGVFAVTRHPMMWAFALWAIAHIVAAPTERTLVTAGAIGILALLGAHLQDRKKRALMGEAWSAWESRTSFRPRFGRLFGAGWIVWIAGLVLWLALSAAHMGLAGFDAGVWRWIGIV